MNERNLDYYDPAATVSLDRPLVLCGVLTPESRHVGYRLAALHGLRYTDLERSIEHRFGASTAELALVHQPHETRRIESEMLQAAVAESPYGVVVVSIEALSMRSNLRLLESGAFLIALDYRLDDCYRRFHRLYPESMPTWFAEAPGPGSLESLYRQWTRRLLRARLRLPMTGLSWEAATKALVGRLEKEHPAFAGN